MTEEHIDKLKGYIKDDNRTYRHKCSINDDRRTHRQRERERGCGSNIHLKGEILSKEG